jgi:Uma2 family endonuclease
MATGLPTTPVPPAPGVLTHPAPAVAQDVPDEPIYRLSVEQYHRMIEAGVLDEDDPVELLEGWLVKKMPKNPPHGYAKWKLAELLRGTIAGGWIVKAEDPVTATDSEPEPDLTVVRGRIDDYRTRHPGPEDTALAAEVADSSLRRDRGLKKRIYARAGIPVYWIVNLVDRRIEVYTEPSGPAETPDYGRREDFGPEAEVPVALDGREVGRIAVREVLP